MNGPTKGIPKTPEHRAAISRGAKGTKKKPWTEERKAARRLLIAEKKEDARRGERSEGGVSSAQLSDEELCQK